MEIKVGDIVEYQDRQYRVLRCAYGFEKKLHLFNSFNSVWAYESDVKLIESIEAPSLKRGDKVIVNDVPSCEKTASNGIWVSRMNNHIGEVFKVGSCMNHEEYGPLVSFDGLWFRTYHLEKAKDYDII